MPSLIGRSHVERFSARRASARACIVGALALGMALTSTGCLRPKTVATAGAGTASQPADTTSQFESWEIKDETRKSGHFILDGKPFCFSGTNNYYLPWKSPKMCDDVLTSAKEMQLTVMRTWGNQERGSLDGSMPNTDGDGTKEGVYYQYWDPKTRKPAYNGRRSPCSILPWRTAHTGRAGSSHFSIRGRTRRERGTRSSSPSSRSAA
ncbi:MAG TPA: hypothetical protein VIV60_36020, partial [Polyangiaceae bacterium]